jgi:hypothetical protein
LLGIGSGKVAVICAIEGWQESYSHQYIDGRNVRDSLAAVDARWEAGGRKVIEYHGRHRT